MIVEVAEITVTAGDESAFEAGVQSAAPIFPRAKGCRHGVSLHSVVEHPHVDRLLVTGDTVDDHMVGLRNSDDFQEWRRLVSPYFDRAASVTHFERVAKY